MKKLIIFLILATFFIVSCGGSKKTENNDTDILPDEDVTDVDESDADILPDEDTTDVDESDADILPDEDITDVDENDEDNEDEPDESADTDEENPCDPNPCEGKEHTTGECIVDEWYDNMGVVNYFSCVCDERYSSYYWNGWKCTNECEGDPCQYQEHAIVGSCSLADTPTAYECDCEEGYHWAYFDCEQDFEEN